MTLEELDAIEKKQQCAIRGLIGKPMRGSDELAVSYGICVSVPALIAEVRRLRDHNATLCQSVNDAANVIQRIIDEAGECPECCGGCCPPSHLDGCRIGAWLGHDDAT